jgi:hypothetical protein
MLALTYRAKFRRVAGIKSVLDPGTDRANPESLSSKYALISSYAYLLTY